MFSITRFADTFTKELRENKRTLLMRVFVMTGIMCLFTLFIVFQRYEKYGTDPNRTADPLWISMLGLFVWSIIIFGAISASSLMKDMSDKQSRLSTIMYPASKLEKYLARWIIYIPLFLLTALAACFLSDLLRYVICRSIIPGSAIALKLITPSELTDYIEQYEMWSEVNVFWMAVLFSQSLFALGSIFFQKHPMAKTFIAVMLIATVYYIIGYVTYKIFDSGYWYNSGMISGKPSMGLLWCLVIAGCIINYALSYWRFRESEIIQRW